MTRLIPLFVREDTGAASVDWVVLTAAVIALALASIGAAQQGVVALGGSVTDEARLGAGDD
jgi:Flp pilus assembly pilin Flp